MSRVFLFGYGSLLNKKGRDKTYLHEGHVHPVVVHDLARGWFIEDAYRKHTAVCVFEKPGASVNGALLEIHADSLSQYDARETGYKRVEIARDRFDFVHDEELEESDHVFVYEPLKMVEQEQNFPITQSYIDITMRGFLDEGEDFALQFLETTLGWDKQIINDRGNLWFPRGYDENDSAGQIDELLHRFNPAIVKNRLDLDSATGQVFFSFHQALREGGPRHGTGQ